VDTDAAITGLPMSTREENLKFDDTLQRQLNHQLAPAGLTAPAQRPKQPFSLPTQGVVQT
jgi:hypothetical protein